MKKKRGYVFRLAIDVMTRRLGLFVLTIFLGIVSFSLIYSVFMTYMDYSISDRIQNKATNYSQKQSYYLNISIFYDELENLDKFKEKLSENDNVEVGNTYSVEIDGSTWEIYFVDSGYAAYTKLTSNGQPLDFTGEDGQNLPAYVGSAYEEKYPIGTKFSVDEEIYQVVGILDDEQIFVSMPNGNQLYDSVPSEKTIIGLSSEAGYSSSMYVFSYMSQDELQQYIKDVAREFEYGFRMQSIYDNNQENRSYEIEAAHIVITLSYILLAITFVVVCVVSVSSVFLNSPTYAVLYAFGYDHKDMYRIIMLENGVRVLLSVVPAYAISCLYTYVVYGNGYASYVRKVVTETHALYGGGLLLALGIVIFIVSTVLPVFFYKRMSVTEILKCKE